MLHSVKARAIIFVSGVFCVIILAVTFQALRERNAKLEIAEAELYNTARVIVLGAQSTIESTHLLFAPQMSSVDVRAIADTGQCQQRLAQALAQVTQLSSIALALPNGEVICSAVPLRQALNIADRPYFQRALASSDDIIGQAFDGRVTGTRVLPIYRAVRDENGAVQAVVSIEFNLSWLNDALAHSGYREGARVGLVDAQGLVLARHPDPEHLVGQNVSNTAFFKAAVAHGGEGIIRSVGFDKVPRVYGLVPFYSTPAGPLTLWIGYDADTVTADADRNLAQTLIGAAVLLSLLLIAVWFGVERLFLRPISILSNTARRLGSGDLSVRSGIGRTGGEFGVLARSMDEMAESLASKSGQVISAHRALKVLSEWNRVAHNSSDEQVLTEGMCKAIVGAGGYQMAWVGFAEDNPDKTVRPVAFAGDVADYYKSLQVTWADTESGQGPAGRAIREGVPIIVSDARSDSRLERWREHVGRFGYASIIAIPLKTDDRMLGALVIGAAETGGFAENEGMLLGDVAKDFSSAIFALRSRHEREQLKAALKSSAENFAAAAEASADALFVFKSVRDGAGKLVDLEIAAMNDRAARQIGMAREDAIGKTYLSLLPRYKTLSQFDQYAEVATTGIRFEGEFSYEGSQKGMRWFRQQVVRVGDGIAISLRDITDWRIAGDKIREAEERLRLAMASAKMGAWSLDLASDALTVSEDFGPIYGLPKGAGFATYAALMEVAHPDDRERVASAKMRGAQSGQPADMEHRVLWPDGTVHWVQLHGAVALDALGKPLRTIGVVADITQRKRGKAALNRANRALMTLSAGNEALVHATSESELLHSVCRAIVEKGGYRMASVGYPQADHEKTILPMAWAGVEDGYFTAIKHTWADNERGQRPIARALRSGKAEIARDARNDPAFEPVKDLMGMLGYASNLALPLLDGKQIIGAMSIHASDADSFDETEVGLLQELAEDLAYGITTLRTRAERDRIAQEQERHEDILRLSLVDSIQAIATTVEMRDPYTSGHQNRVSLLAMAIAKEMGLDDNAIEGIHLAGIVHDLGKIAVPAEILSKPGKLSTMEFELIKGHAQAGYDILKEIKFPWPLANIVWEHHERVDGSGYPRGLKGDEILLESRIMAVADVMEAMASHRPYRASLGIEPGLREIERGRGTAYDPLVVDACLTLFREKHYVIPTAHSL